MIPGQGTKIPHATWHTPRSPKNKTLKVKMSDGGGVFKNKADIGDYDLHFGEGDFLYTKPQACKGLITELRLDSLGRLPIQRTGHDACFLQAVCSVSRKHFPILLYRWLSGHLHLSDF